jgi:hypothetical protein
MYFDVIRNRLISAKEAEERERERLAHQAKEAQRERREAQRERERLAQKTVDYLFRSKLKGKLFIQEDARDSRYGFFKNLETGACCREKICNVG